VNKRGNPPRTTIAGQLAGPVAEFGLNASSHFTHIANPDNHNISAASNSSIPSFLTSMKHRCHHLGMAFLSALLVLPSLLRADVVIMKDGKKYPNARVLSETPDTVTFDYVVVGTIHDTRTEPRTAIDQIIKQKPEETEIVALRKLLPTADLLTADKYESLIQDQLRPFVTKYANTPQATEVEGIIKTLQAEKEKVVGGAVKMEGEWIQPDMVKRDAHSIDAFRVRRDMNELAAESKLREALIEWQSMSNPNEGYTDTLQYVKAIPEVLEILTGYKKQLDRMIVEQPALQKRRTDSIAKMLPTDPIRVRTQRAIDAELLAFKTQTDVEKKMKPPPRWLTIYKYDLKSLQSASKVVIDEMAKLKNLDIAKLTTQNEALVAATRFLADGNIEQAETALNRAAAVSGLSSSNKSVQTLRAQLAVLKREAAAKRTAQRAYGNGKINALSTSTIPTTDSRVADALAAAEKAKEKKKGSKDTEKSDKLPLTNAESPSADDAKEAAPASHHKDKDKGKARKPHTATAPVAQVPAEEGGIQKYLFIGGGGLLAVLLTVMFLQKRKQKA